MGLFSGFGSITFNMEYEQIKNNTENNTLMIKQVEKLISGEINTYSMEKRYYNRNGDVVWALLAVSLVRHTDGTPLYFIAQIEDINELKRTEQVNQQLMERITLANEAGEAIVQIREGAKEVVDVVGRFAAVLNAH